MVIFSTTGEKRNGKPSHLYYHERFCETSTITIRRYDVGLKKDLGIFLEMSKSIYSFDLET